MADHPEPPADETPARQPAVQPRRNPSTHRSAAATTTNLTDLVNLVKSVQALAEEQASGLEPGQENVARRKQKFSRTGGGEERSPRPLARQPSPVAPKPVAEALPAPEEVKPTETPVEPKNVAWPRLVKAEEPDAAPPAPRRTARKRRGNVWVWALGQAFSFGLIALGYWLARQTGPAGPAKSPFGSASGAAAPASGPATRVSERAFDAVNFALHAAKTGDAASARQLYESAFQLEPAPPGTWYRLALLAWQGGDLPETERQLARSIQAGENVAACSYIRARMAWDQGDAAESVRQLQAAAHAEPFDGRYLFYWGEALRRQGKTRSAAECFEQAMDRPSRPEDGQLYTYKLRLLRAESGRDEQLGEEVGENVQQPGSGGWHLIAAAQAIARAAFPEAADHLKKAASTLSPAKYDILTRDYFFQKVDNQPTLSALLTRPATPTDAKTRPDPASASPEAADPALWPAQAVR